MATLRPLIILPARFFLYTRGTIDLLLFVSLLFLASVLLEQENSPAHLYSALSVCGVLSIEILSSHTFPYDLLYICPALGPR